MRKDVSALLMIIICVPVIAYGAGAVMDVWTIEERISWWMVVFTVFWTITLVESARTYRKERRELRAHQAASSEEEPAS